MTLPELAEDDCVQVVMIAAFYNAHFKPLLEREDFQLAEMPSGDEEMRTFVIVLGERRGQVLRLLDADR